jgi:hypothetical protein
MFIFQCSMQIICIYQFRRRKFMYKTMLQYAYIYLKEENLGGVKAPSRPN